MALQRAHEFVARGDFASAAILFEQIAREAESHQGLRAPFLFVQAGVARIKLGQSAVGTNHLKHGLSLFIDSGQFIQLYRLGSRAVRELKARGMNKEAQDIAAIVHSNMPARAEMPTERGPNPALVSLPRHCVSCGGPLHADEVEWVDTTTCNCPYCGSPARRKLAGNSVENRPA